MDLPIDKEWVNRMNKFKLLAAGIAFAATSSAANAAVLYANKVIDDMTSYGACHGSTSECASNDRQDAENALGAPDTSFYALGYGGTLTVGFAKELISGIQNVFTFEVTFGSVEKARHFEAADVYSILNGVETLLGRILNVNGGGEVQSKGPFEYIKLVDATEDQYGKGTTSFDGFDVESISIAPVPLPAAGGMLLLGLGGMAALRRRNKAA